MRLKVSGWLVAAALLCAVPARADVRITMSNGTVTVIATDATIRQILTEWARVGQTRIVNIERVSGAPVSLELANVPEAQALDTILRSVSGYLAAPRAQAQPNASTFDRIYLLPTSSAAPARPAPATASQAAPPTFTPPTFPAPTDQDEENPARPGPVAVPGVPPNPAFRGPAFTGFQPATAPPPQPTPPPAGPVSYPAPTAPVGVSTPGMVVPAPQQPGQPQPARPDQR